LVRFGAGWDSSCGDFDVEATGVLDTVENSVSDLLGMDESAAETGYS
jgi:hypothetical protein